ncbi:hypothetical protein MBAV_001148 [Candidatus Magnetobacterium bavaricum]|uniref:Uncharacterized protein n=1 Tax=Candidatus Magnetobacterium bavaricum TaxID=29290 RepID=A0A0F3GXE8_9BACT|nr:hypothetical protein MBAV_001148 [Candidatus Magnetobacterium bavaricum]
MTYTVLALISDSYTGTYNEIALPFVKGQPVVDEGLVDEILEWNNTLLLNEGTIDELIAATEQSGTNKILLPTDLLGRNQWVKR